GDAAVLYGDLAQGGFDIPGHTLGIATHVAVRSLLQPAPQLAAGLAHAILDIDLVLPVTRPGRRQARKGTQGEKALKLLAVKEVGRLVLVTEEQPGLARRPLGRPLVEEGAEWRDAGAWADHDDRRLRILGQGEVVGLLHVAG